MVVLQMILLLFLEQLLLEALITAAILNQEYQVVSVTDGNTYTIQARTVSTIQSITETGGFNPTLVNANGSDTGNGGSSVVGDLSSWGRSKFIS